MKRRKILNVLFMLVLLASVVGGNTSAVLAEPPAQTDGGRPERPERLTQADREAAASRAEEAGFTLETTVTADMNMGDAPHYFSHPNYANSPLPGNPVSEWNAIAQEYLQPSGMMMGGISMSASFVYLAYMQGAIYDALVAIEGGYTPYAYTAPLIDPTASREAAVAAAAYTVLKNYFPDDLTLDAKYTAALAAIADSPEKDAGIAIGVASANAMIALRSGDVLTGDGGYVLPQPGPGVWEPTVKLPDGSWMPPMDPFMAKLAPFLRADIAQYRPVAPPDLTDPEYASNDPEYLADFEEVRDWGGVGSTLRTPEQTAIAMFWGTNMVIQMNTAYRQVAETRGFNLIETARLMALGNMVASDSLITTFDSKYTYSFWRPVTAIRHTNPDGTYSSVEVNSWVPVMMTPNFPEYVAGHGSFVSSQAEMFTQLFGTPQIELDLMSTATGAVRHYATAADLRTEVINARTWGGLHFRRSTELASDIGQQFVLAAFESSLFDADPATDTGQHVAVAGGIRKFVDKLPGLNAGGANNLGQYIPVAVPDTTTYPGSDYYEIAVVQYREKMHSDLPPTLLRGYVQLSTAAVHGEHVQLTNALLDGTQVDIPGFFGVTPPHYLGPTIVAEKNRPVRIKFYNLLPTGIDGDLFIPVDVTVMGAGMGADLYGMVEDDPQNPMCGMAYDALGNRIAKLAGCYTENRATLHLHGGISPWISDGTPHQWITPANETASYPQGVSVVPVPDMADSGAPDDGVMTFYYTNQQGARLMFYHDHSWGITRLNVYAGEAAPYLITDTTEQSLVAQGLIPDAEHTIPLVVQDKTFVPSMFQLALEDETWDTTRWGGPGNLWLPHVYSPAQNPGDSSGVNQFGRWAYGPWFWPPTTDIEYGPVANPYYDPLCNPDQTWCEPPLMPGTPFNSMGMEAFMDTPVVNGTAYPTLTVDPTAYRFRVLNAANDRFFNLSIYKAVDANGMPCDINNTAPAASVSGLTCTEVALNPDEVAAALADSTIFPTPLAGTEGPEWIQIGNEGGFLPAPAVIPAQPTTWVNDPTVFNAGNVDQHSLLLAPAERADVIVDFSAFAGQTLILYNDAPAAFPARDPRYDYYTGNGDYRDTGGAPSTLSGYGPNTRTVMQIKVAPAAAVPPTFDLTALQTAFKAVSLGGQGVFELSQNPIIVGQGAYNSAYGTTFQINGPDAGLVQIFDTSFTFKTLANGANGESLTFPLQPKMIQDEMGEAFDREYGRMSGFLGVETPNAQAGLQNMILYPFRSPPTEILKGVEVPLDVTGELVVEPITTTDDGTQIWKITHNGVDTHPIHVHLYDIQLINRVGWDGIIRRPDPNELGWKETLRISPLEDTIIALRPILPVYPFDLPNSVRLIDPMSPEGIYLENTTLQESLGLPIYAFNPDGEPIDIINHYVNYGAEYVWHCHILSHEEMDMMHAQVVGIAPSEPTGLIYTRVGSGNQRRYELSWTDTSTNETAFVIERRVAGSTSAWSEIAIVPSALFGVIPFVDTGDGPGTGTRYYTDRIGNTNTLYEYQVYAINVVGDVWDYSNPALNEIPSGGGFPTLTLSSRGEIVTPAIAAPGNLTASAVVKNKKTADVTLNWTDNSDNETGFLVQRADNATFTLGVVNTTVGANIVTLTQNLPRARSYYYRVLAFNETTQSNWSNIVNVVTP